LSNLLGKDSARGSTPKETGTCVKEFKGNKYYTGYRNCFGSFGSGFGYFLCLPDAINGTADAKDPESSILMLLLPLCHILF
jgi:hypothetical protein